MPGGRGFSDPSDSMTDTIANIICNANNSCGDGQKIFAYLGRVSKKKSKGKQSRSTIGNLIKQAREDKGLTQEGVAKLLGIRRQGYAHYEYGHALPTADDLPKLCEVLGLDSGIFGMLGHSPSISASPTDDPLLSYVHQLWALMDGEDRRAIIEASEGRLTRRGIPVEGLNQRGGKHTGRLANGD